MTREDLITAYLASGEIPKTTLGLHLAASAVIEEVVAQQCDLCAPEFSVDVPMVAIETGTSTGAAITLPGWFYGSRITAIETPDGSRRVLRPGQYAVAPSGEVTVYDGLPAGASYRITYTALHALPPSGEVTIPASRLAAFFRLVTARLLSRIATAHGETRKPEIAADSVDYQSKAREYLALAREALAEYRRLVGLPEKDATPRAAGSIATFEPTPARTFPLEAPWPSR